MGMSDRIKKIRTYYGLTQAEFGRKLDKTEGYVSQIERGRCGVSDKALYRMCALFFINPKWLAEGLGEMLLPEAPVREPEGVGERLRAMRKEKSLTQQELADKMGYSKIYIHYVENGRSLPSDEFLSAAAKALNVSLGQLKSGVNDELAFILDWLKRHPEKREEVRRAIDEMLRE